MEVITEEKELTLKEGNSKILLHLENSWLKCLLKNNSKNQSKITAFFSFGNIAYPHHYHSHSHVSFIMRAGVGLEHSHCLQENHFCFSCFRITR